MEGVDEAVLMIGTETNKTIMRDASLLTDVGESAGSGDLIIAVAARSEEACDAALLKPSPCLPRATPPHPSTRTTRREL